MYVLLFPLHWEVTRLLYFIKIVFWDTGDAGVGPDHQPHTPTGRGGGGGGGGRGGGGWGWLWGGGAPPGLGVKWGKDAGMGRVFKWGEKKTCLCGGNMIDFMVLCKWRLLWHSMRLRRAKGYKIKEI